MCTVASHVYSAAVALSVKCEMIDEKETEVVSN